MSQEKQRLIDKIIEAANKINQSRKSESANYLFFPWLVVEKKKRILKVKAWLQRKRNLEKIESWKPKKQ
jgi:hypothetical protein